jgi:hypothetical protein
VCDALLVDTISRSDTYPYVDVREDDVSLGHEATVSKVGEDQIFYLMSRGMAEDEAMAMVVRGFVEPIARELPMEYALELNRSSSCRWRAPLASTSTPSAMEAALGTERAALKDTGGITDGAVAVGVKPSTPRSPADVRPERIRSRDVDAFPAAHRARGGVALHPAAGGPRAARRRPVRRATSSWTPTCPTASSC